MSMFSLPTTSSPSDTGVSSVRVDEFAPARTHTHMYATHTHARMNNHNGMEGLSLVGTDSTVNTNQRARESFSWVAKSAVCTALQDSNNDQTPLTQISTLRFTEEERATVVGQGGSLSGEAEARHTSEPAAYSASGSSGAATALGGVARGSSAPS